MIKPNASGVQKGEPGTTASPAHYSNLPTRFNTLTDANSSVSDWEADLRKTSMVLSTS